MADYPTTLYVVRVDDGKGSYFTFSYENRDNIPEVYKDPMIIGIYVLQTEATLQVTKTTRNTTALASGGVKL